MRGLTGLAASAGLALVGFSSACEYDSPPRTEIVGLVDRALTDTTAPIVLRFSEPISKDSLSIRVVRLDLDSEGNLGDEDSDDATGLVEYFRHDPTEDVYEGGFGTLSEDGKSFTININSSLPVGPSLAVLIEPGLSDEAGNSWEVRQRLVFAYTVVLACESGQGSSTVFPSGAYFFVADIVKPIGVQIQLFAQIEVDPETGRFVGQFTNADRNPDDTRCSPACGEADVCQTIPTQGCVIPSAKVGSDDEFPDFVPNATPPTGYSFRVTGCIADTEAGSVFLNAPADIDVQQPDVFVKGIKLSASFVEQDGVFVGTGVASAVEVFLGVTPGGVAEGTMLGRQILPGEEPPGIPAPAAE
jgi:hypothetical protein